MQKKIVSLACCAVIFFGSCFGMEKVDRTPVPKYVKQLDKILDGISFAKGQEKLAAEKLEMALDHIVNKECYAGFKRGEERRVAKMSINRKFNTMMDHLVSVLKNEYDKHPPSNFKAVHKEIRDLVKKKRNWFKKLYNSESDDSRLVLLKSICKNYEIEPLVTRNTKTHASINNTILMTAIFFLIYATCNSPKKAVSVAAVFFFVYISYNYYYVPESACRWKYCQKQNHSTLKSDSGEEVVLDTFDY